MSAEENISQALRPVVDAAGLEIWDVERSGNSVRVLVERADGVDLDAISKVSAAISALLDQRDDLVPAGRYTLEVSSPGLERRLRYPSHFARYVGEEIAVKTAPGTDGARRLRGTLVGATDDGITVRAVISGTESQDVGLPLSMVERASTVFTWGPAPKAARSQRPAKKAVPDRDAGAAAQRRGGAQRRAGAPADGLAEASEEAR